MKLALIICGEAIDADVIETLQGLGLHSYTKLPHVIGQGKASGPHLGDHIWPGTNSVILVVLEENRAPLLLDALRPLKERFSHEGLKLYFLPVEDAL